MVNGTGVRSRANGLWHIGNLYGVDVYVDQSLTEDEAIVFQAGIHVGASKLRYEDFANLVHPKVAEFHQTTTKMAG